MKAQAFCMACNSPFSHYKDSCPQCNQYTYHWKCGCGQTLTRTDYRCFNHVHPLSKDEAQEDSFNPWKH